MRVRSGTRRMATGDVQQAAQPLAKRVVPGRRIRLPRERQGTLSFVPTARQEFGEELRREQEPVRLLHVGEQAFERSRRNQYRFSMPSAVVLDDEPNGVDRQRLSQRDNRVELVGDGLPLGSCGEILEQFDICAAHRWPIGWTPTRGSSTRVSGRSRSCRRSVCSTRSARRGNRVNCEARPIRATNGTADGAGR